MLTKKLKRDTIGYVMKTSMKHLNPYAKPTDRMSGRSSILMIVIYAVLFGGWLVLQLQN